MAEIGMIMMGNDIVLPQENIQFIHFGFPVSPFASSIHVIENNIQVFSPVIQFGDVSFLQGIIDCQGVKAKAPAEWGGRSQAAH